MLRFELTCLLFATSSIVFAQEETYFVGRWLEHAENVIQMKKSENKPFGGWQTSGLTFDELTNTWWSISDQNATEEGDVRHRGRFLYQIDFVDGQPIGTPFEISWDNQKVFDIVHQSFKGWGTGLIDFEAVAADPANKDVFFACTEGKEPWLVEIHVNRDMMRAVVKRVVRLSTLGNHSNYKEEYYNLRWEGLAVSPVGDQIYLATEWIESQQRIYSVSLAEFRQCEWKEGVDGHAKKPPRLTPKALENTKGLLGELSGLCFAKYGKLNYLLVLERNSDRKLKSNSPPKLYVAAVTNSELNILGSFSLDLRAPDESGSLNGVKLGDCNNPGRVSPEGIATDGETLRIVGDPTKKYYQSSSSNVDKEKLTNLIPLVFEIEISTVFENVNLDLHELMGKRCSILLERFELLGRHLKDGKPVVESIVEARRQLREAELLLYENKEERLIVYAEDLQKIHDLVKTQFEAGQSTKESLLLAEAELLQAKLDLIK